MNDGENAGKRELIEIAELIESLGIRYWIDGGWGVDLLVGKQTRPHRDVDIDCDGRFTDALLNELKKRGYEITTDWRPCRIELYRAGSGYLDIHPLEINPDGSARQASPEGSWYDFEARWFSSAFFEGRIFPCISAEAQKLFHSGYELRDEDKADIKNIDMLLADKKID